MIRNLRTRGALAVLVLAAGLTGCVSLLPKSDPVQLYSFGHEFTAAAKSPAAGGERIGVLLSDIDFPRAAQGDELLTMTGGQVAYIANTRWVAPAVLLFREGVENGFGKASRARLLNRGEPGKTGLILRLEVRDFQILYAAPEAIPEVAVTVEARLSRVDGSGVEEKTFQVRRAATENRVSVIVDVLDDAVGEVLGGVVAWTDEVAATVPASATVAIPPRASMRSTTNATSSSTTTTVRPVTP